MNIPCKTCPVGGGRKLPVGYIKADFLESTGTQYIDTGLGDYGTASYKVQFTEKDRLQLMGLNGIELKWGCTKEGYYRCAISSTSVAVGNVDDIVFSALAEGVDLTVNGTQFTAIGDTSLYDTDTWTLFAETPTSTVKCSARLFTHSLTSEDGLLLLNGVGAIDPQGVPCMYDKVTGAPFYNSGAGSFIVGLTKAQAKRLSSLPPKSTTTTLQISLPASILDSSNNVIDTEVKAAMDKAEANGWKFSITSYTS